MTNHNPNQVPLGERAKGGAKIRCLADIFGTSKDAQDRIKAIRQAIDDKGEDVLPNFSEWPDFHVEEGYPNLLVPYEKDAVLALDPSELDPTPQVPFRCTQFLGDNLLAGNHGLTQK